MYVIQRQWNGKPNGFIELVFVSEIEAQRYIDANLTGGEVLYFPTQRML